MKRKNHSLLLFKNALKQALRNKIQLVALAVLVLLSSTIFSLMQTSIARINHEYDALVSESNLHDFVIDLSDTAKLNNVPDPNPAIPPPPKPEDGIASQEQGYINQVANETNNMFTWDRVEARTLQLNNNDDPKILKLIAGKNNDDATIDKLVISEGYDIGKNPNLKTPSDKQVVINKQFAQKNNLKIGDIIRVNVDTLGSSLKVSNYDINDPKYSVYNWLQIVGFGNSADFITPIIDQTTPLPNKLREGILYVDYHQFGLTKVNFNNNSLWYYNKSKEKISITSNKDQEIYYVAKSVNSSKNNLGPISDFLKARYVNISDANASLVYALGDSSYRFNSRTATLPSTITGFTTLLILLLLIVLLITGITVVLVTYKNIDNSKPAIGILKSLGYSNWKILFTSLAYPMIAALIGTIAVFLPASGLQILVVNVFSNYFNLNFGSFIFDGLGFLYCLILTFGFLSIIAWVISALTVIKKPIDLINNVSTTRNSSFTRFVKKTSAHRNFLTRFRLALFTSSIGKMAAVTLTMFLGTVLMTTAIIGPKIMADNKRVSYTGMNYQTLTEYSLPAYNSPFSFYKTYNPNLKPWDYTTEIYNRGPDQTYYKHPVRSDDQFANDLYNNNINSEAYAPISPNVKDKNSLANLSTSSLPFLYGKMFTKGFLDGLDQSNDPATIGFIQAFAWPEATPPYGIANQQAILPDSNPPGLYNDTNYSMLRTFYINYRSTIAMGLNPQVQVPGHPEQLDKTNLINFAKNTDGWKLDDTNFTSEANTFAFDTSDRKYPWHLMNESEFLNNPHFTDSVIRDKWIRQAMIWFYALFYNRVGQAVAQGTYTKSPYFIKQNIANAFQNPDKPFNISFNTIPFDKTTDELGSYFVGTPENKFNNNSYPIKVYGLQSQQELGRNSLMQLYDASENSLNAVIQEDNVDPNVTNIVINKTIAKQLGLNTGSDFQMSTNGKIMEARNSDTNPFEVIKNDQINYDNVNSSTPKPAGENNVTLLNQNIKFNQINNTISNGAYSNIGINASPMVQDIAAGNVVISTDKTLHKFKVVGVYNGYGQPVAYISKNNADKLLNYDAAKPNFYDNFKHEWEGKTVRINGTSINLTGLPATYQEFISSFSVGNPINTMFKNEFPIFNFKFSSSSKIPDIESTFSVSNIYGDYSALGLNGGTDIFANVTYQGHGEGSASNILPLIVHKQLLNQISQIVDAILISFIVFALIISFFIILITSDLVIYENRKVIATMKTLGYSNAKITNIVIGMYLPIIAAMFIIGFPIGWIIVQAVINYLAFNTVWVLPLFFTWWLPVVIAVIVLGIYLTTFLIEWNSMKKIRPLKILNEST